MLEDKVAVVTGASTGFGRAISLAYARAGARLVVADLTEAPAEGNFDERPDLATADLIASEAGEAFFQHCDVTAAAEVEALAQAAGTRFGRLDIWVNNAGVYRGGRRIHEMTEADLEACWSVLVKGSWFGTQAALRRFLAQGGGGVIVNIVSTAGLRAHRGQSVYNMAKAAQANLTRCTALEYAADGVRCNGVCPTYMKTAMSRRGFDSPEISAYVRSAIPAGRWGETADVAAVALFLASDAAAFLEGALIPVDGGEILA